MNRDYEELTSQRNEMARLLSDAEELGITTRNEYQSVLDLIDRIRGGVRDTSEEEGDQGEGRCLT